MDDPLSSASESSVYNPQIFLYLQIIIYCIPKLDVRYKQNLTYYVLYQVLADISLSVPHFQKY